MMTYIFPIILYLVILPMASGVIFNFAFRRSEVFNKMPLATRVLDDYVSGFLIIFFSFEIAGLYICSTSYKLSDFVETITGYVNLFLTIVLIASIVIIIIKIVIKIIRVELVDDLKTLKPVIHDVIAVGFVVLYIIVSLMFILPSPKDDTYLSIFWMQKNDVIGVYNVINGELSSNVTGHTKLIEVLYIVIAKNLGISDMKTVLNIMIVPLMIVFMGIYKRIEYIFFGYNIKLSKYKKWTEVLFACLCIVLLFVNGSLNISIPQNIWNGITLLSSMVLPLGFIYGYATGCEMSAHKPLRAFVWFIRYLFIIPIAALMSNYGYPIAAGLGGLIAITIVILVIINCFRKEKGK